jgi:hypothetical protein
MKEQDLIDLGFKRTDVTAEESGYERDWYYYDIDFGDKRGISLISPADNEVVGNKWFVEVFEDPSIRIENKKDLEDFIRIINKIKK